MSKLSGSYVENIKGVVAGAVLSRQNAVLLGAPGEGKTEILRLAVAKMLGQNWIEPQPAINILSDHSAVFVGIEQNTPVEAILGVYNPEKVLKGQMERNTQYTVYDKRTLIGIYDEIGRGAGFLFDAAIQSLGRKVNPVPVVATSNFMPTDKQAEAMLDRFALWHWVRPGSDGYAGVVKAQLQGYSTGLSIDGSGLPNRQEIEDVWQMQPGNRAIKAISDLVTDLATTAKTQGYKPNKRRITQWSRLLFAVGAFASGSDDFNVVPDKAVQLLKYCWPSPKSEEEATWATIAAEVVDPIGGMIEFHMTEVYRELELLKDMAQKDRTPHIPQMGLKIQAMESELRSAAGDDERVDEAVGKAQSWLSRAMLGQPLE